MEQRYGHIQHFNEETLSNLLGKSGFDILKSRNFRVPDKADALKNPLHREAELLTSMLAKKYYPELWGGFYVAFCKSQNCQVINPTTEQTIIRMIKDELGKENLVSLGLFGSATKKNHKQCSDLDFTVVLRDASDDISERETASPRLKKRLKESGIRELCAFNIYTLEEFENADKNNSWLIETMKNGYRVIVDTDNYLSNKLANKKPIIEQISQMSWKGIQTENPDAMEAVSKRYKQIAEILKPNFAEFSTYYEAESYRGELMAKLLRHGIYDSKDSLLTIAKKLKYKFGEEINLETIQKLNFEQEISGKPSLYRYDSVEKHLAAAAVLQENNQYLGSLFHTYSALKCIYLERLHSNNTFAFDGEITQLFLREQMENITPELIEQIYQYSFRAEQMLGRSGYTSFDIDKNGKGIFATENGEEINSLTNGLRLIINELNLQKKELTQIDVLPKISVAIATYNRPEYLEKCIESINNLVIPKNILEIVIVDDGSTKEYNIEVLRIKSPFSIRYIKKEHSGICATKNKAIQESRGEYVAFIDDDMIVSPLWIVSLMSGFTNENVAGVGSTNLTYPSDNYLMNYSDYRELARKPFRDETGEILNVLTGSACVRKRVLEEVGGFNQRQSDKGVPFGGDDVDVTWKIRNSGHIFNHVEDAVTFHNHRSDLKSFIKQHIGYGEGTMFHCIDRNRNPAELGIPNPEYMEVAGDLLHYLILEVPKRVKNCYQDNLGLKNALKYPTLDFMRRFFYDVGILKARKFIKKYE